MEQPKKLEQRKLQEILGKTQLPEIQLPEKIELRKEQPSAADVSLLELLAVRYRLQLQQQILDLIEGKGKMDYKTTVSGFVTGLIPLLALFGVSVPEWIAQAVIALGSIALGYFAADAKKKNAQQPQQ